MTLAYSELLELAYVAPIMVAVIAISYSLLLLGATRSTESRRAGQPGLATAYLLLATASGAVFAGSVVAGISVIVAG